MLGRKGLGAVGVIVIVVVAMFLYWLLTNSLKTDECEVDSDCGDGHYCGSDFSCHEFKIIEKTSVELDLLGPSIIIGIAIVAAAYILRRRAL
jgi:ABC-type antimicrobial peptide transport system permease subunit